MISFEDAMKLNQMTDLVFHARIEAAENWGDFVRIRVEVLDGPLAGQTIETDSDWVTGPT